MQRYSRNLVDIVNVSDVILYTICHKLFLLLLFKITNHEEVISQSLCEEDTKTKVVNYLSKVNNAHIMIHSCYNRWI